MGLDAVQQPLGDLELVMQDGAGAQLPDAEHPAADRVPAEHGVEHLGARRQQPGEVDRGVADRELGPAEHPGDAVV
ncbi:MAG: hypothetical protein D3X82_05400 [Candidatus Leucobacter sulfamidivorax]|nr:hypothetical protein [Candidatus Leucobacter sulfamidivorax]